MAKPLVERHAPSGVLWTVCFERLRELRGQDVRATEVGRLLDFEHQRAIRWRAGSMYIDRAGYLLRLADALDIEPIVLVDVAAGRISADEARRLIAGKGHAPVTAGGGSKQVIEQLDEAAAGLPALGGRPVVLAIVPEGAAARKGIEDAVKAHPRFDAGLTGNVSLAMLAAERWRPELVLLDLVVAGPHAYEACRVLSTSRAASGRTCRVVAGAADGGVAELATQAALMAGASVVMAVPFDEAAVGLELKRAGERLGRG